MSRAARIALISIASIVSVAALSALGVYFWLASVDDQLHGSEYEEVLDVLVESEFDEPFYMMLIGSDARSDDASMGARSDTNIVARVDASEGLITLISIPRDTMIDLDGSKAKFNAAYAYYGVSGAIEQANELLGIEISHYAEVNFETLEELVDAIGGVDIEVESTINDSNAGSVVIEEGTQHLDGEAALVYARSRAYADGDFTRTYHQRMLVSAIAEKVLSLSLTELPSVVEAAAQCVTTDLTVLELIELASLFQDQELTVYSCMVPSTTGTVGGVSYVFTDTETLEEMMEVVEAGGDPSDFTASPSASIDTSVIESLSDEELQAIDTSTEEVGSSSSSSGSSDSSSGSSTSSSSDSTSQDTSSSATSSGNSQQNTSSSGSSSSSSSSSGSTSDGASGGNSSTGSGDTSSSGSDSSGSSSDSSGSQNSGSQGSDSSASTGSGGTSDTGSTSSNTNAAA